MATSVETLSTTDGVLVNVSSHRLLWVWTDVKLCHYLYKGLK